MRNNDTNVISDWLNASLSVVQVTAMSMFKNNFVIKMPTDAERCPLAVLQGLEFVLEIFLVVSL